MKPFDFSLEPILQRLPKGMVNVEMIDMAIKQRVKLWPENLCKSIEEHLLQLPHLAPENSPVPLNIENGTVMVGERKILTDQQFSTIYKTAQHFKPWKKGPYNLFGIPIDAEWRSDLKWDRVKKFIKGPHDLDHKTILDIGCNNGHFMFQMAKNNQPRLILGIDPMLTCYGQFQLMNHYLQLPFAHYLPIGVEHVPAFQGTFDIVFSMGIIYHHRHPLEQLQNIFDALRPGGQLILETIGIPGEDSVALFPNERYANMKNVFFVPTLNCLINWVKRCHFEQIEILSDTLLTSEEQRRTEWSPGPSLEDYLNPNNPNQTIEGHVAPRRFAILCRKKFL